MKITVLNNITNNTIISPAQDICYGTAFNDLSGTTAPTLQGGDNIYKFKWESNINGLGWVTASGTNNGSGYNPAELPQRSPMNEYYFRRVVYSGIHDVCVSTSPAVLLRDYPVITNNSITANQTICSGSAPVKFNGSTPLNGNAFYTYQWQDSSKLHTWADIAAATASDYQAPSLTDTTSYRRIVNSSSCTDYSKSITVIVHKPILNNNITLLGGGLTDTTICNGSIPNLIKGTIPTGGTSIPGDYAYLWYVSFDNSVWNPAPGANSGPSYQPAALISGSYYYKRQVTSGACTLPITVSATVRITVLPPIANNFITSKTSVCYNTAPSLFTGSDPTGGAGAGSYSYFWEQSTDGTSWSAATGTNTNRDYQAPVLTVPMKYRRTVKSGANNCCSYTSSVFNITIDPLPTGIITSVLDTTLCEGGKVRLSLTLTGSSPWQVIYRENTSQVTSGNILVPNPVILATPATPTAHTTFNYSLFEVKDNNGCIATSLSGARKADVYKVPVAYAGPDADTCCPKFILKAKPSSGTGTWYFPATSKISNPNDAGATITIDSLFSGARATHKFYWEEINWQCKSKDSVTVNFDKRINKIDAGPDTTLYSFDNRYKMAAHKPDSWQTGKWSLISGTGDFVNDSDTSTVTQNLSKGLNSFLWTVKNGKCTNTDIVNITVYGLVIPEGFSPNNDSFNNTFEITGLDLANQFAELKIVNGAGTEVYSITNENWKNWDGKNSKGIDLPEGTYYYLLKLTSKGNGQVFKKSGFIVLKRY